MRSLNKHKEDGTYFFALPCLLYCREEETSAKASNSSSSIILVIFIILGISIYIWKGKQAQCISDASSFFTLFSSQMVMRICTFWRSYKIVNICNPKNIWAYFASVTMFSIRLWLAESLNTRDIFGYELHVMSQISINQLVRRNTHWWHGTCYTFSFKGGTPINIYIQTLCHSTILLSLHAFIHILTLLWEIQPLRTSKPLCMPHKRNAQAA